MILTWITQLRATGMIKFQEQEFSTVLNLIGKTLSLRRMNWWKIGKTRQTKKGPNKFFKTYLEWNMRLIKKALIGFENLSKYISSQWSSKLSQRSDILTLITIFPKLVLSHWIGKTRKLRSEIKSSFLENKNPKFTNGFMTKPLKTNASPSFWMSSFTTLCLKIFLKNETEKTFKSWSENL